MPKRVICWRYVPGLVGFEPGAAALLFRRVAREGGWA